MSIQQVGSAYSGSAEIIGNQIRFSPSTPSGSFVYYITDGNGNSASATAYVNFYGDPYPVYVAAVATADASYQTDVLAAADARQAAVDSAGSTALSLVPHLSISIA